MRQASQEFSDNLLKQTEDTMLKALSDIKTTRQAIKGAQKQLQQAMQHQQQQGPTE